MSQEQIQEIELTIEEAKRSIAMRESLFKLLKNKDFKSIVTEGYFKDEAVRLVMSKAAPAMQTPENQEQLCKSIDAIGIFDQYLRYIVWNANQAEKAIKDSEDALVELRNEE